MIDSFKRIIDVEIELLNDAYTHSYAQTFVDSINDTQDIIKFLSNINHPELSLDSQYWVLGIVWGPGTDIIAICTLSDATLISSSNGELLFSKNNCLYRFAEGNLSHMFQIQDRIVFDSSQKLQQFLTMLQIKFSSWQLILKTF